MVIKPALAQIRRAVFHEPRGKGTVLVPLQWLAIQARPLRADGHVYLHGKHDRSRGEGRSCWRGDKGLAMITDIEIRVMGVEEKVI